MKTLTPLSFDRIELMSTFVRIVESKSLSAAAISLRTTQPTISRRLKLLENSLEVKLLQRTTHQMSLTEEGRHFYFHAKELLDRWMTIETEIKGTKVEPRGTFRIQVPHALGQEQLIPIIHQYIQLYPKIKIEWILKDKMPDFLSENIDCSIHVGFIEDPSLVAIKIFEIPRIIVAAPKLAKNFKKISHPKDLSELPWLSFKTYYYEQIDFKNVKNSKDEYSLKIVPHFSTDSLYALKKMTILGHGVCVTSKWVVEEELQSGKLVQVCPNWEGARFPVYLTYPQSKHKPAKLTKFIELIKKVPGTL